MTRIAILIPSPGEAENVAAGTSEDCIAWKNYLRSNAGGAWDDAEIRTLPVNPSSVRVLFELTATVRYEYAFVAFSGHGKIEQVDDEWVTKLLLNDKDEWIPDYKLRPQSPWGLVSVDSCRWDSTGMFKGLKFANESVSFSRIAEDLKYREAHRALFDSSLAKCERGTITLYGCDFAEFASGKHKRRTEVGGLFSFSLIEAANAWYENIGTSGVLSVLSAHKGAVPRVKADEPEQNPIIEAGRRLGFFPFSVKP